MGVLAILTGALILLGAVVMVMSMYGTRRILPLVNDSQYRQGWRTLFILMVFFAIGYIVALGLVLSGNTDILSILTGIIFLSGAVFVFIAVGSGYLTISELRKTQNSLTQARDEAVEASRLKSELLARVSHELRTPLHTIMGYADILDNGELSDKQNEMVQRITVNSERLMAHINNLLQQAQIEAGELTIHLNPIAPRELVDYVNLVITPLAEQKDILFTVDCAPDVPTVVLGDILRLEEIVTNLVGNAVKFTEQGRIDVRIYTQDDAYWVIEVEDTGKGICEQDLSRIFSPFQQVDGSMTRLFGGTGLGLSIVKQVTELMGGYVAVKSELGRGSCFVVVLPLLELEPEWSAKHVPSYS